MDQVRSTSVGLVVGLNVKQQTKRKTQTSVWSYLIVLSSANRVDPDQIAPFHSARADANRWITCVLILSTG